MKYIILCIILLGCIKATAQQDTAKPVSVELKIDKEYQVKLPAKYFSYDQRKSDYDIKADSVFQTQYDITITLRNNSIRPVELELMTCSWQENFRVNNDYISFYNWGCDGNFPETVRLAPNKAKVYKGNLRKSIKFKYPCEDCRFGQQIETTKIGLITTDDLFEPKRQGHSGYAIGMRDESLWKIIWSNPVYLLTKEEAQPQPEKYNQMRY